MNNDQNSTHRQTAKTLRTTVGIIIGALFCVVAILYGQRAFDYIAAQNFRPDSQIASINDTLAFTSYGKQLFYASKPQLQTQQEFNSSCQATERTAAMLGCYYQRKIFLFNVTNEELRGANEVTAAHEMLHAAYERLTIFEKADVDRLVDEQYQLLKDDSTIKSLVGYYEKAEPRDVQNELHSIIGTTVVTLSPELESYYGQYFSNRGKIVQLNSDYNAVFKQVEKKAKDLVAQIEALGPAIESDLEIYDTDRDQMESDITVFNERATSGDFSSRSAFTVARDSLVARVNELNARRAAINTRVDTYNQLVADLKVISVRSNELNQSINGITSPATSID